MTGASARAIPGVIRGRVVMKALAFAMLALALMPVALAEPAAPPYCGPVDATTVTPTAIAPGASGAATITVKNNGQNPAATATVNVAATTATTGWRVTDTETRTVTLAPGSSTLVKVNVTVAKDAKESGIINFAISGSCPPPGNLPCPNQQCDFATRNASATIPLASAGGFSIPGLDAIPIEYIAGAALLIVLVIVLIIAIPKRSRGFKADCPEPLKMVRPGRGASFPLDLRNETDGPVTARFELSAVPEGWSAFLPLPEVQLAAKESRSLWLMVRAPIHARVGEQVDVEVSLTDAARPQVTRKLKVRAEVNPEAPTD